MADESSQSTASLSAMKDIVSAVKSGQKDRGAAINELRSILLSQSSSRKAEIESQITESTVPIVISEDGTELTFPDDNDIRNGLEADDFHSDWNSVNNSPETKQTYTSMDDSMIDALKNNRAFQAETAVREEMYKDFTFKPNITELPQSYGHSKALDEPFMSRVEKWKKEKELDMVKKKEKVYRNSIADCTFKPAIHTKPTRSRSLKPDENLATHERLFQVSNTLNAHRAQFIEEELRREQREEDALCTFAPKLETSETQKFAHVKPKYTQPAKVIVEKAGEAELAKCTFSPAIIGVTPKMKAAEQYVNTSVVERLSQTKTPTNWSTVNKGKSFENSVVEMDDYLKNKTPVKSTPAKSTPGKSTVSSVTKDLNSSSITVEDFNSFISRQQQTSLRKERHIEQITKNCTPDFKPKLCDKSLLMTETNFKGEFMERLEKDGIKRNESEVRLKEVVKSQYSFQPSITPKSEKLRPRSVDELSHGDMLRKESNSCMLKLRIEQEEMAEMTFQPEISKKAKRTAKSVLKLHEDPGKVIQMHDEKEKKREQRRLELEKERQDNEIVGCTFHPKTKECPDFVLRIKKTMDAVKETKKNTTILSPERPEWK